MCAVLFSAQGSHLLVRSGMAVLAIVVYAAALFVLRTFSSKELHHAREGIAFVSPFIESWSNKLRRNP